ncbi:flagellar biosynthesis anti-sigma factor FlgM [Photobacterium nomapromontoriensis]|uniref:flagellar biosynthesis anti-sigma factor FlgM n=1 Tax=Photobacterium nomapromontoriensis TaxID=2910237 RepID=UPI003D1103A1
MIGKITYNTQPAALPQSQPEAKVAAKAKINAPSLTPLQQARQESAQQSDVDMDKVAAAKALLRSRDTGVNIDSLASKMIDFYQDDA